MAREETRYTKVARTFSMNAENRSTHFPPPSFLAMPAAGIDVSDHGIKFIEFCMRNGHRELAQYGERALPEGVIVGGEVAKPEELVRVLSALKKETGLSLVRSSLHEQGGYLFQTTLSGVLPSEAHGAIEFQLEEHIPLSGADATFDAERVSRPGHEESLDFVVTAFPEKIVRPYVDAFEKAGLRLLSLELEAQAIARAVVPWHDSGTFLIVDLGDTHTGVSAVSSGVVHYTSTIDIAGRTLNAALSKSLPLSPERAERIKNERASLDAKEDADVFDSLMTTVSALSDEVARRILYWDTHCETHFGHSKIEHVYLCGGNANVPGLENYFATNLHLPVSVGNVWMNAFHFNEYVPSLPLSESHRFATAIGLALRNSS